MGKVYCKDCRHKSYFGCGKKIITNKFTGAYEEGTSNEEGDCKHFEAKTGALSDFINGIFGKPS